MPFLLITFLAIALIVIIIGLVLSARNRVGAGRAAYYAEHARYNVPVPMRVRPVYRPVEPVRARRYRLEAERRGRADGWIPTSLDSIYRRADGSTNWTTTIITLVVIFLLGLYLLIGLLPSHALIGYIPFYGNTSSTSSGQNAPHMSGASAALVRLGQLDPGQYDTTGQYNTWAYSACSAAAMTEVINAYGHHYRIIDILKVESQLGEITPASGLLEDIGIQRTMAQFGFKTMLRNDLSLDQIVDIANHGQPVIVDFPPYKYPGGHLLVVLGGNAGYVYVADSSRYDRHIVTRARFMQWWTGLAAIGTPQ